MLLVLRASRSPRPTVYNDRSQAVVSADAMVINSSQEMPRFWIQKKTLPTADVAQYR